MDCDGSGCGGGFFGPGRRLASIPRPEGQRDRRRSEDAIRKLEFKLAKVEELRQQKIVEIMEMRKFRKGLENLRDKAKEEFDQEQSKIEQNDSDDKTSISYARKIIQQV